MSTQRPPRVQERGFFTGPDGLSFYYEQDSVADSKGVVILLHGYADHCGRYGDLVDRLAAAGYDTWRFDYRGHGRSGGRRGHVYRFEDYFDEIRLFRDKVIAATPDKKRFMVGHSHGGLLTLSFAAADPSGLTGLVLSSPFVGFGLKVPGWKSAAGKLLSRIAPTTALPTDIDPTTLSHDPEVARAYATDKLVGTHATARWFTEMLRVHAELPGKIKGLNLPILIQQGADDRVASPPATRAIFEAVGGTDKSHREYPGLMHEIYFELRRDEPIRDLIQWLNAHT